MLLTGEDQKKKPSGAWEINAAQLASIVAFSKWIDPPAQSEMALRKINLAGYGLATE